MNILEYTRSSYTYRLRGIFSNNPSSYNDPTSYDLVVKCSVCEEEISRETVILDATDHADNDGDGYCDACNELLDPTVECECNCHKEGVSGFFWNIRKFFIRIFRTNQYCDCGAVHY